MKNIAFIVEGLSDKVVVETLARRLLPPGVAYHTVPLGGKAALPTAYVTVLELLHNGFEHVFILFDSDSTRRSDIEDGVYEVAQTLGEHRISPELVTICPVVPEIETWLLANFKERPEIYRDIKMRLAEEMNRQRVTRDDYEKIAQVINLYHLRERSESFSFFADKLLEVTTDSTVAAHV